MTSKVRTSLFTSLLTMTCGSALAQAAPATGWQSSAAAGLTLTRGNSSTLLATLGVATANKWDNNELSLGADGVYGTSKINGVSQRTAGSIHGFIQYNWLFSDRFFGFGRLEGLNDSVAAINYRGTISAGLGYYLIKNKTTDLSLEIGPGFVFEDLSGDKKTFATLRGAEKFHHQLSDRARVWETAEIMPQVDKFSNFIVNAEVGIEADLTADKKLSLRAVLQDTYNSQPAEGRYKNDAKIITAIAYKF